MDRSSLGDSQLRASLFFLCALSQAADGARTCSVSISYVLQPAEPMLPTACSTQQIIRARARGQITQASQRPLLPTDPVAHSRAQREWDRDMCSACRRGEMSVNVHWITIYTNTHQGQSVSRGSWEEPWASVQKDRESCCHGCTMEDGILSTNRYQLVQLNHFRLLWIGISLLLFCMDSFPGTHSAFFSFCFRPLTLLYFFNHEVARL